jgi:hypothetical protein
LETPHVLREARRVTKKGDVAMNFVERLRRLLRNRANDANLPGTRFVKWVESLEKMMNPMSFALALARAGTEVTLTAEQIMEAGHRSEVKGNGYERCSNQENG